MFERENTMDFINRIGLHVEIRENGQTFPRWDLLNKHNTYKVKIERDGETYTYDFCDSLDNTEKGKRPDEYDVLACLEKYPVGSFQDFCDEFGYDAWDYDADDVNAGSMEIYRAVKKEAAGVERVFGEYRDEFAEICW